MEFYIFLLGLQGKKGDLLIFHLTFAVLGLYLCRKESL